MNYLPTKRSYQKLICIAIIILSVFISTTTIYAADGDSIVYVTDTGRKYHRYNCTYLKSVNAYSLYEAIKEEYAPCTRCNPPTMSDAEIYSYELNIIRNIREELENSSSSTTSSSTRNSGTTTSYESKVTPEPTNDEDSSEWFDDIVMILALCWPLIGIGYLAHKGNKQQKQEQRKHQSQQSIAAPVCSKTPAATSEAIITQQKKRLSRVVLAVLVICVSVYVGIQIGKTDGPNRSTSTHSATESSSTPTDYIAKDYKKTVYVIEENGNWSYHDSDCKIISGIPYSINSMTKQDAVQYGYHRCNKCKP